MLTKSRPFCVECGSLDVAFDAWAEWDTENQKWIVGDTYDNAWCQSCEKDDANVDWEHANADGTWPNREEDEECEVTDRSWLT
jgi:hypothetical protein